MKHQSSDTKVSLEIILVLKILLGCIFVMSEYVIRRMNVYIGFLTLIFISTVAWFGFMIHDFINYKIFEVVNSIFINVPLATLCVLSILSYKYTPLFKYRFVFNACTLGFCSFVGVYYGIMDLIFMDTYSHSSIAFWGLLTDAFRAFGGMFLFLALLDDKDAGNL